MGDNVFEVVSWPSRKALEGTGVRMMRVGRKALVSPLYTDAEIVVPDVKAVDVWRGETRVLYEADKVLVLRHGGSA